KVRLRTMTLSELLNSRVRWRRVAPFSPNTVVLEPGLITVWASWLRMERTRASSSGPDGSSCQPPTSGSAVAWELSKSYSGSARSSQVSNSPSGPSNPSMVPLTKTIFGWSPCSASTSSARVETTYTWSLVAAAPPVVPGPAEPQPSPGASVWRASSMATGETPLPPGLCPAAAGLATRTGPATSAAVRTVAVTVRMDPPLVGGTN